MEHPRWRWLLGRPLTTIRSAFESFGVDVSDLSDTSLDAAALLLLVEAGDLLPSLGDVARHLQAARRRADRARDVQCCACGLDCPPDERETVSGQTFCMECLSYGAVREECL